MSRPEDHRRPPKRIRPALYSGAYTPVEALKIFSQDWRVVIASVSSGAVSQVVLFPLDAIKTRMQAYKFSSVFECIKEIRHNEGGLRKGLYRGMFGPLVSYCVIRGFTFKWYQDTKYYIDESWTAATGKSLLVQANTKYQKPTLYSTLSFGLAGAITGFGVSFLACPFELLKNGRQMSGLLDKKVVVAADEAILKNGGPVAAVAKASLSNPKFDQALHASHRDMGTMRAGYLVYQRVGIRGLYSGIRLHALRDTLGNAIFFSSYESLKQLITVSRGYESGPIAGGISGGFCGVFSFFCTYPIDTVKTKYQRDCLFKREGVVLSKLNYLAASQYQGLTVTLARVFISSLISMYVFEYVKQQIRTLDINPPHPNRHPRDPLDLQSVD